MVVVAVPMMPIVLLRGAGPSAAQTCAVSPGSLAPAFMYQIGMYRCKCKYHSATFTTVTIDQLTSYHRLDTYPPFDMLHRSAAGKQITPWPTMKHHHKCCLTGYVLVDLVDPQK